MNQVEKTTDEYDDMYDYCPTCGETWDKHTKGELLDDDGNFEEICNPLVLIMQGKPRFFISDIMHYNDDFLWKIIEWQDSYIQYLESKKDLKNIILGGNNDGR